MKIIYNTETGEILDYPRADENAVEGLQAPLVELTLVEAEKPAYNPSTQTIVKSDVPDLDSAVLNRSWEVVELPLRVMTAEEWLQSVGLGSNRQPTLLFMRQTLTTFGRQSPLLDSLEAYFKLILDMYVADPSPRTNWPLPPTTFEAALQEISVQLNAPNA